MQRLLQLDDGAEAVRWSTFKDAEPGGAPTHPPCAPFLTALAWVRAGMIDETEADQEGGGDRSGRSGRASGGGGDDDDENGTDDEEEDSNDMFNAGGEPGADGRGGAGDFVEDDDDAEDGRAGRGAGGMSTTADDQGDEAATAAAMAAAAAAAVMAMAGNRDDDDDDDDDDLMGDDDVDAEDREAIGDAEMAAGAAGMGLLGANDGDDDDVTTALVDSVAPAQWQPRFAQMGSAPGAAGSAAAAAAYAEPQQETDSTPAFHGGERWDPFSVTHSDLRPAWMDSCSAGVGSAPVDRGAPADRACRRDGWPDSKQAAGGGHRQQPCPQGIAVAAAATVRLPFS